MPPKKPPPKKKPPPAPRSNSHAENPTRRTQTTANIGSFLHAPTTRTDDLLQPHIDPSLLPHIQTITDFLNHHRFAMTASIAASPGGGVLQPPAYYASTVEEFRATQWSRQSAGLRTNTNKEETTAGLAQLVEAHSDALTAAMDTNNTEVDELFTVHEVCRLHGLLLAEAPASGVYRTTNVRAGRTYFGPPQHVPLEVDRFLAALHRCRHQTEWFVTATSSVEYVYHCIALAALAMLGISKIHPFKDGNGRLSRIYANGILSRLLGLPFPVTFTATPQQRQEYIDALQHGDRRARALTMATSTMIKQEQQQQHSSSPSTITVLGPLVHVIVDRIVHAVSQLDALLRDRAHAALNAQEAVMARRVRERAATGQCTICLDDKPNIATLCCGQAVHLHCLAEWLANHATCVACRGPLPQLPAMRRTMAHSDEEDSDDDDDDSTSEDWDETTSTTPDDETQEEDETQEDGEEDDGDNAAIQQMIWEHLHSTAVQMADCRSCHNVYATPGCSNQMCYMCCAATSGTCHVHDETSSTTEDEESEDEPVVCVGNGCNNKAAGNCENNRCGRCCRAASGLRHCRRHAPAAPPPDDHTTTEEEEEEETTEDYTTSTEESTEVASDPPPYQHPVCVECHRNRSAATCSNGMCGTCCVLNGRFHTYCERHHH